MDPLPNQPTVEIIIIIIVVIIIIIIIIIICEYLWTV